VQALSSTHLIWCNPAQRGVARTLLREWTKDHGFT